MWGHPHILHVRQFGVFYVCVDSVAVLQGVSVHGWSHVSRFSVSYLASSTMGRRGETGVTARRRSQTA